MDKIKGILLENGIEDEKKIDAIEKSLASYIFAKLDSERDKVENLFDETDDFDMRLIYDKESQLLARLKGKFEEDFGVEDKI